MTIAQALRKLSPYNISDHRQAFQYKSFQKLLFEACLFKVGSYKQVVQLTKACLGTAKTGLGPQVLFKKYIFKHFCAGETFDDSIPAIKQFHQRFNVTAILDHSVEDVYGMDGCDRSMTEKVELIRKSAKSIGNEKISFIPIKCTSLIESTTLEEITQCLERNTTTLADGDIINILPRNKRESFDRGYIRFQTICKVAQLAQIPILLDAEQTHRQPAIELIYRLLAIEFNKNQHVTDSSGHNKNNRPIVYNTYQAYLTHTEWAVQRDLQHAIDHDYTFAIKLVRGAYYSTENERAKLLNYCTPIHATKLDTDSVFDGLSTVLITHIASEGLSTNNSSNTGDINNDNKKEGRRPKVNLLLATHNNASVVHAIHTMSALGLPQNHPNIHFAQIMGMTDNITFNLGLAGYNVSKLVLFGEFSNLMPWLVRRLEENQDGLSGMQSERKLLWQEIKRRLTAKCGV